MELKKLLKIIITVFGLTSLCATAGTQGQLYGGIQLAKGSYEEEGFEEVNPTALVGRLGKYVNNNFSIEGRLGFGLQDDGFDDEILGFPVSVEFELDTLIGVYGVGHIDLNESASVYGLIGLTKAKATATVVIPALNETFSVSGDETDLSFGIGADIGINDTVAINIEYMQYLSKSEFDFSALAVGMVFGF